MQSDEESCIAVWARSNGGMFFRTYPSSLSYVGLCSSINTINQSPPPPPSSTKMKKKKNCRYDMISVTNSRNICCHRALRALAPSSESATPILVPAPSLPPLCLTFFFPIPPINQFDYPRFRVTPSHVSSNMHLIYLALLSFFFFLAHLRNFFPVLLSPSLYTAPVAQRRWILR